MNKVFTSKTLVTWNGITMRYSTFVKIAEPGEVCHLANKDDGIVYLKRNIAG